MIFQNNLKKFLKERKLKMNELSKEINVPVSTIHGWVHGVPPKNIFLLKKLAMFMECSLDDLFSEDYGKSPVLDLKISISLGEDQYRLLLKKVSPPLKE